MHIVIRDAAGSDADGLLAIFNHWARETTFAFPDPVPRQWFEAVRTATDGHALLAAEADGELAGFALMRPWHPANVFDRTAEVGYFIAPERLGLGLGGRLLAELERRALARGVDTLLASIATDNQRSQAFHAAKGFAPAGLLEGIGRKFGRDFGVVLMLKRLD